MKNIVVELKNVVKHYKRGIETVCAVEGISLQLNKGEMVALTGPSGCGKSTCLNLITGVDIPDEGSITVNGKDVTKATRKELTQHRRFSVGTVFQSFHLLPQLTLEENITIPLSISGKSNKERVNFLIDRVGLSHRKHHYPSELSGGEQQRTAIARALVQYPVVMIGDEPTGNLDQHTGEQIMQLLDDLRHEEQTTLLLATHDMHLAQRADRVIQMRDGRIVDGDAS
jgi:putative ABC transport system ATP-binding protein